MSGYSKIFGRRSVDSLFNLCIRVLSRHVSDLHDVGVLPPEFLVRILKSAPPEEVDRIEKMNPQIGTLDPLWKEFSKKYLGKNVTPSANPPNNLPSWKMFYYAKKSDEEQAKKSLGSALRSMYNSEKTDKDKKKIQVINTPRVNIVPMKRSSSGGGSRSFSSSSSSSSSAPSGQGKLMAATLKDMRKKLASRHAVSVSLQKNKSKK